MIRSISLTLLAVASITLISAATAEGAEKEVQLFDGRSLAGWDSYLVEAGVKTEDVWSVEDGILVCKGEPMGYLFTKKDYTSFKLIVEWRWAPGAKPGNSGVLLRITGKPMALPKCVEAQLQHGNAGALYGFHGFTVRGDPARSIKNTSKMTGELSGVKKIKGNENAPGAWNRYEITLDGDKLIAKVNGEEVNRASGCDVVAGKIGLQSEGGRIEFRTVKLIALP